MSLIGVIAATHHRPERTFRGNTFARDIERRKRQRRRIVEIARHEKPPRRQQTHRIVLVAAGLQIRGEEFCRGQRRLLVLGALRVKRRQIGIPILGKAGTRPEPGEFYALGRPCLIAFVEQRQVEKPLARIVDDIERQRALIAALRLILDDEAQLADLSRRGRPLPFVDQRVQMALVIEPRHRIIRLRRKIGARHAAGGHRFEHRETSAAQQAMNQRGDEDGLAGVRKPGDPEPDRRIEQMAAELCERSSSLPDLFNELVHNRGFRLPPANAGR